MNQGLDLAQTAVGFQATISNTSESVSSGYSPRRRLKKATRTRDFLQGGVGYHEEALSRVHDISSQISH